MKSLAWLLQAVVTLALLTAVGYLIDFRAVLRSAAGADPYLLGLAALVLVAQPMISALRWVLILRQMQGTLRLKPAVMASVLGAFLNQLLPGAISGDAVRLWVAYRHGNTMRAATTSVVIDRIVMLAVLLILGAIGGAWTLDVEPARLSAGLAAGAILIGVVSAGLFWFDRIVANLNRFRLARALSYLSKDTRLVLSGWTALAIVALCAASYGNLTLSIYIIAKAVGIGVDFLPLAMMLPLVLLASVLPASLGGWGAREVAMIIGMGWLHIEAGPALTTSVLFGLLSLIAACPGVLFYKALRRPNNAAVADVLETESVEKPTGPSTVAPSCALSEPPEGSEARMNR